MVFKRRNKPTLKERLQVLFYPKKGWLRGMDYIGLRMKRLPGSPHTIALGAACGVLLSFTPFFGFHILAAMGLAFALRGNVIAAFIGTWFGNPITFPFIVTASIQLGWKIMGVSPQNRDFNRISADFKHASMDLWHFIQSLFGYGHATLEGITAFFFDIFLPYTIGGSILGTIAALTIYFLSRPAIRAYQHIRREKMIERRAKRLQQKSKADSDSQDH